MITKKIDHFIHSYKKNMKIFFCHFHTIFFF